MKYLLSYSNFKWFLSQKKLAKSALSLWADKVFLLNSFWLRLQKEFWNENKKILRYSRGAGYWIWKPFILSKILPLLGEDDVLVYSDLGNSESISRVSSYFSTINNKWKIFAIIMMVSYYLRFMIIRILHGPRGIVLF